MYTERIALYWYWRKTGDDKWWI